MKTKERIQAHLDTIERYIGEHGLIMGTVSWQMALYAIHTLREDLEKILNEVEQQGQSKIRADWID